MKHLYTTIISSIITALISSIITFILGSSIYYFNKEQINVSISESININNQYITSLSIKNYESNKSIDEINLWLKDVRVQKIDSDLQNLYNEEIGNIKVSDVIPEYKGTIILYTDKGIDENNLKVETGLKNNIVFLGKLEESAYINIRNYLILAFIYFVEMTVAIIINKKIVNKQQEKCDELEKEIDRSKEITDMIIKDRLKNRLTLQKKLADYSKELNFWRDTIRKLLYKSKNSKLDEDTIFRTVTNNLKTYRTSEKCDYRELEDIIIELKEDEK